MREDPITRHALSMPLDMDATEPVEGTDAPPGGVPEWVHLIPAGTFMGRDGRGPFTLDGEAVLRAFRRQAVDLPVDYEHQSLTASERSGPVPAAGWIKDLDVRADGLWGRVQWTERARELLAAKEYRYLSPVFRYEAQTGRIVELTGAGLTHTPNLILQAAASASHEPRKETHTMPLPESVAKLLGVPADCPEEEAVAACRRLIDRAEAAEAAHRRGPDPAEYVPVALHREVADQLAKLQDEMARRDAEAAVAEAMAARKISPGLREWAMTYARRDLDGFRAFIAAAPEIVPEGELCPGESAHSVLLTDEDRIAAKLLGLTEEAFAQAKGVAHG